MITDEEIRLVKAKIEEIHELAELKSLKEQYLGQAGYFRRAFEEIGGLRAEERAVKAGHLHELKNQLSEAISQALQKFSTRLPKPETTATIPDSTLPLATPKIGHYHPITEMIETMNDFFIRLGYSIYFGPEIETDEYNFERLGVPKGHPARDMQDTIYVEQPNILMRTHTSSLETRALAALKPPFRIVCPGKVYRNEKANKSNHFIFHQYQAVVVEKTATLAELFGTLEMLFKHLFGEKVILRFRHKYYPEVEPGVGPDMLCFYCQGKGCMVCKNVGWTEMGGAGLIHQNIFKAAGIDRNQYSGFAFGLGLDRWVMAKHHITDIRTLLGGGLAYPYYERATQTL